MPLSFSLSVKSSNLQHKNRQYLKNQQTVLSSPYSPCQTVLKFPEIHARQFWIFSAFYLPLFDQEDANTVCRQLGFARGAREFYGRTAGGGARGNTFGPVPTPFRILSGLNAMDLGPTCAADGARLQDCPNFAGGVMRAPLVCPSNQVAGVVCVA